MKTIGRLKLNQLTNAELNDREMKLIKGGVNCSCGCHYYGQGGSSTADNSAANYDGDLKSYGGGRTCSPCSPGPEATEQAFWNP